MNLVPQEALGENDKGIDGHPRAVSGASASMYGAQARMATGNVEHGGGVGIKVSEKGQENGGLSTSDPGTP